ncbi:unnamed protein product [Cyclocybe aegerita]|uniref:Thioredoxin domain-containing protein n=1 Tax=Cyclocybe aegerita TaxID=1973307 RepID=A0A8S0VRV9_CYCAE|nr:unnamed protein product [Cyclocybe aegerita]
MPVWTMTEVAQYKEITSRYPVVVMFCCESWSPTCQQMIPLFNQYADDPEFAKIWFYKIDCDVQPDISHYCNIVKLPTFFFFKNGQKTDTLVGSHLYSHALLKLLRKHNAAR